jgi:2,3-bisphosphoglycerate-independent phosphoglycerate mutase
MKNIGEDLSILIAPDHPTPISIMTHVSDPVPYLIYRSNAPLNSKATSYTEEQAEASGIFIESGVELMKRFLQK